MIIGIVILVALEAWLILHVIRLMAPAPKDPEPKDDWRRFGDEWNRRQ